MAVHTYTTRTVVHHEWILSAPAHYTDVGKAYSAAEHKAAEIASSGNYIGDIYVTGRDEDLVISFTEEKPL